MTGYYEDRWIRARILEYFGGSESEPLTAEYLTAGDQTDSRHRVVRPVSDLEACWNEGAEISRSHWDKKSLIAHLDIEYVNFDFPAEPYLNPDRVFVLQQPVEWVAQAILLESGLTPLHLLSGRGHHFVWRIRQNSDAFERLVKLGHLTPSLEKFNQKPHPPNGSKVSQSPFPAQGNQHQYRRSRSCHGSRQN